MTPLIDFPQGVTSRGFRAAVSVIAVAVAFVVVTLPAGASPGQLDPTFGSGGSVSTAVGFLDRASAVARQPDGKLVVAGGSRTGALLDETLVRYTPSGSLDPSFGIGGVVVTDTGGRRAVAVAVQPDGKLVTATQTVPGLSLVRYLSNGNLDATFGVGGIVQTPIDGNGGGTSSGLALQPDGRIIAAGTRGPSGVDLVRYTADGIPDSTFGTNGAVSTPFPGPDPLFYGLALTPDGKILVQASSGYFGTEVARYDSTGVLDPGFGVGGSVQIVALSSTVFRLQPDDKILIAGLSTCGTTCDIFVIRLLPHGARDTTFGTDGLVTTDLGAQELAYGLALQPDGKLLVAGAKTGPFPSDADFLVARYTSLGALDASFGTGGVVTTDFGASEQDTSVLVQPDSKIVVAGDGFAHEPAPPTRFLIARYLGDDTMPLVPSAPDLAAASDSGASGTDNLTNKRSLLFAGTAGAGAPVRLYRGAIEVGSRTADAVTGAWSIADTIIADGVYSYTATIDDLAGIPSEHSAALAVTVDTVAAAPSLDLAAASDSGTSDSDNLTNRTTLVFTGSVEQGSTVTLSRGASTVANTTSAGGTWSLTDSVSADGLYTYAATASDRAGNTSPPSDQLAATVDTVAPELNVTGAPNRSTYKLPRRPTRPTFAPTDTGSGIADKHDGWTTPATSNGAGTYTYTATATDRAGNTSSETRTYTVTAVPSVVKPVIGKPVTVPKNLVAGKSAVVSFTITRSDNGRKLTAGTMICDPSIKGKVIPHREQFKNGTAIVRFTIPKTVKGKQLKLRLMIKYKGNTTSRTSTFRIK